VISLRRPDKRNRIEPVDLETLLGHLGTVRIDPTVRVVLIEATGPSWCSGFHLGALADRAPAPVSFGELCDELERVEVPTIAVIAGSVHGGGTDLALACDLRIASHGVTLGMPAARIGLQYYASGLRRKTIGADELLRIGYLTDLVVPSELRNRVDALCEAVCGLAPLAARATKSAIDELGGPSPDLDRIQDGHVRSAKSEEHAAAMRLLRERRTAGAGGD